ncbi:hypothetical protein ACIF83_10320 [Streptomyces sp. NPDC085866]|uniref:hypothetical protein n=1 Tax=Streptomyces sp. NPDC085866 TaxID=3365736 RepID=UPI0037D74263
MAEAIFDEMTADDRAEQDRFVAGRIDIWKTARTLLMNDGAISPEPEDIVQLASFLAGDVGAV